MAHTTDNIRVHLRSHAKDTDLRMKVRTSCALEVQSCLKKSTAPSLHRPPVSMPTTTILQRPEAASSGYLASLSLLALINTAPSMSAALNCGSPARVMTLRKVMSTASLRTSKAWNVLRVRLASRHTRASTRPVGVARFFTRPLSVQVGSVEPADVEDTVQPFTCRLCDWQWQLQSLQEPARGTSVGIVHSLVVGAWQRATTALHPECDRRCARLAAVTAGQWRVL